MAIFDRTGVFFSHFFEKTVENAPQTGTCWVLFKNII